MSGSSEDEGSNYSSEEEAETKVIETLKMPAMQTTPGKIRFKEHVFFLKDKDLTKIKFISLIHPKTGNPARYLLDSQGGIQEIQRAKRVPSSYFINETVKEDGSLFITTPVDPLFLMLRRLEEVRKKKGDTDEGVFVSDYDIFDHDTAKTGVRYLRPYMNLLSAICQVKEQDDEKYFRLCDTKLIDWLKRKVDMIADFVSNKMIDSMSLIRAQAAGFRSQRSEKFSNCQLISISIGFLSEYLSAARVRQLRESYGSTLQANATINFTFNKAKASGEGELYGDSKYGKITEKRKADDAIGTPDGSPAAKKRRVRAHEKIDTKKNHTLSSFFTPKK